MPSQRFIEHFLGFLTALLIAVHLQQGACLRLPRFSASAVLHELVETIIWGCPWLELPGSSAQKQERILEDVTLIWGTPNHCSFLLHGGAVGNTAPLAVQFIWSVTTEKEETKELIELMKEEPC